MVELVAVGLPNTTYTTPGTRFTVVSSMVGDGNAAPPTNSTVCAPATRPVTLHVPTRLAMLVALQGLPLAV